MWKIKNRTNKLRVMRRFFIRPKKTKKDNDRRANLGIDIKLPVKVGNKILAREKRLRPIREKFLIFNLKFSMKSKIKMIKAKLKVINSKAEIKY